MQPVVPGSTDVTVYFTVLDSTTFLPYSSLSSSTPGLALWYKPGATAAVVDLTEADLSAQTDAHSDGKLKHIRDGLCRLDLPDAAVPASEGAVTTYGGTATGYVILGGAIVGKPVEVVSGSLVAASVTGAVGSVTGAVGSVTGAVGSVTGNVGGNVTGSVGSVATGGIAAASIASAAAAKIADVVLRRSWASASASSDGDTLSFRSLLGAVAKLVNKVAVSGSTLTVYKEDDATSLGTQTVTADAAAEPIVSVDTVG